MNQGLEANTSGKHLEMAIERTFGDIGYQIKGYDEDKDTCDLFLPKVLIRNVPFTNLYGGNSRTEYVAANQCTDRRLRIECKSQEVPGSTEEKLPYFYLNAVRCVPETETMLLYGGEHFSNNSRAIEWIKSAASLGLFATNQNRRIYIVGISELRRFVRDWDKGEI